MKRKILFSIMVFAGLVLISGQALSSYQRKGPEKIANHLDYILDDLSHERSLNRSELSSLRSELSEIYWQLQELEKHYSPTCGNCGNCDYCGWDNGRYGGQNRHNDNGRYNDNDRYYDDRDDWSRYDSCSCGSHSYDDEFYGWGRNASIDYRFGDRGKLHIHVNNDYRGHNYEVDWTIDHAWASDAKVEIRRERGGEIYVDVRDDYGRRKFRLEKGGLGKEVYFSGDPYPSDSWGKGDNVFKRKKKR